MSVKYPAAIVRNFGVFLQQKPAKNVVSTPVKMSVNALNNLVAQKAPQIESTMLFLFGYILE